MNGPSFSIRKKGSTDTGIPVGDPTVVPVSRPGSVIYNPIDSLVYVSDGKNWDKLSGVNNPVDILLPVSQNKVARWSEDFPPGGGYPGSVLQDSSLELDDYGNATFLDLATPQTSSPGGNVLAQGSVVTGKTFGITLDNKDPTNFIPIVTPIRGEVGITKESYDRGSLAVGQGAMGQVTSEVKGLSLRNVAVGPLSGSNMVTGTDNVTIGSRSNVDLTTSNAIAIGSNAVAKTSNNVVIGKGSIDDGKSNIIALGSDIKAKEDNTLVLGSGLTPFIFNNQFYLKIQLGDDIYIIPMSKLIGVGSTPDSTPSSGSDKI